jgi:signal transduction histidine kinase
VTTVVGVGHTPERLRAPLIIAGAVPLMILVALPWGGAQLPQVPAFTPLFLAFLFCLDVLTVLLLLAQYRAGESPRLLVLSWAFLWAAGSAAQQAWATPGVMSAHPTFAAEPNAFHWLWISSHVVPPVLIAVALAPWPKALEWRLGNRDGRNLRATLSWMVTGFLLLAFGVVIGSGAEHLPSVTDAAHRLNGLGTWSVVLVNLIAVVVAVGSVARRETDEGLERWAVVVSVTFLGDVLLATMNRDLFSVASYLAAVLGLAASGLVLLAILHETSVIQEYVTEEAIRLEEANAELVEGTRLRDHLTAVVSHDMRTPLTGLQGYLELLRHDDLNSPLARRMLERSWMLTRRLTLLTEDLLAAATLENGDLVVTPELLDITQQLGECASCFPDLDLELECQPGLAAYADPLRLQQILGNLVRNAQKHGAEPVLIGAYRDPAMNGGLVVSVSDAGPGVPSAFVPKLFERYSQGSGTATGGAGLGLSVVRDLIKAHGGEIWYDETDNAFIFTLPPPTLRATDDAVAPGARWVFHKGRGDRAAGAGDPDRAEKSRA